MRIILAIILAAGSLFARETLEADASFWVDATSGDDCNDGSELAPWRSVQFAVDHVAANVDTGRTRLTIWLAPGNHGPVILRSVPGDLAPVLSGLESDHDAAVLSSSDSYAVLVGNDRQENRLPAPATWTLRWLRVETQGAGNRCIVATGTGTRLNVDAVNFGACAAEHMVAEFGADISVTGPYVIHAGATRHLQVFTGGRISWYFGGLVLVDTPHFSSAFARAAHGGCIVSGPGGWVVGSATGKRYEVVLNAVVDVTGAGITRFPGSVSGSVSTGGQYSP